jgi:hypothetical protein
MAPKQTHQSTRADGVETFTVNERERLRRDDLSRGDSTL